MIIVYNNVTRSFSVNVDLIRSFSLGTMNERMRDSERNPKMRCRIMMTDYKRYYESNKSKFKGNERKTRIFLTLFSSDFMSLFNSIVDDIKDGGQLNTILGLQTLAPNTSKISRDLSLIYRRALSNISSMGAPSTSIYRHLTDTYREFFKQLTSELFPGIESDLADNMQLRVSL